MKLNATPKTDGNSRGVIPGDVLYFRHAKHGVLHGRVNCCGKDGATIEHDTGEDGFHRVGWNDILGHKQRRVRKLRIIDSGEDGHVAEDEDGNKVYIDGSLPGNDGPDEDDDEDDWIGKSIHGPFLIDIGHLHGPACDHALEGLHKALNDEDGVAFDIWALHDSPFVRDMIEQFSKRGLTKLAAVQDALFKWVTGQYHVPAKHSIPAPPGYMGYWTREQLDLVRIYLESIPPGEMTLFDWTMLIDYLVQRYMAPDALYEEAEWLAVKANLMGKVQAHAPHLSLEAATAVMEALPQTVSDAKKMFRYSDAAETILEYGRLRCCDAVTSISEAARHRLKSTILDYEQQRLSGAAVTPETLQTKLFDQFSQLNKDWRRIAVTEAGEMENQGVIAYLPRDSHVRRVEMYYGACPFCKKLDGRVFRVTTEDDPDKNGWTDVWPGKTNMGRSSSPMKRVGNSLVPRGEDELLWPAAGVQHPHCRGRWEPMAEAQPGDDPKFAKWLQKRLKQVEGMKPGEGLG